MEFFNSNKFIALIVIILIVAALSGCTTVSGDEAKIKQAQEINKEIAGAHDGESDTIGNMPKIVDGVVCVFAPDECIDSTEKKEIGETEDLPSTAPENIESKN